MKPEDIDYHLVVDSTPALIFSARPDGYVDYFNRRWLDYLGGVPLQTLEGWGWMDFIHPEDIDEHVRRWRAAMIDGHTPVSEARVRNGKGEYRWMLHRTEAIRDPAGYIIRWFGSSIDIEELKRAQHELHALKEQLYKENITLRDELVRTSMFDEIVGTSEPLRQVLAMVAKVSGTDSTVLITGETGTGKELIARAIHKRSPRAGRPFVSVNCGAIPPALVASELFGHEKGAFTGAVARRLGRFELADGGTLFLDEVGDLPADVQVKLLRVLQEREFERVGGADTVKVDVRVVSATHRDLEQQIAAGEFREDLYYRLNVFPITLPPLRDRPGDIPMLCEHFIQKYSQTIGKRVRGVDPGALASLASYPWPGNVRELENVIERAMILARGAELTAADLEFSRRPGAPLPPAATTAAAAAGAARPGVPGRDGTRPLHERLSDQERAEIIAAIDHAQGNIALAARTLGINRSTLYYRLRKHGLEHLLPMKEAPNGGEAGGAATPVATPNSGTGNPPQS